LQHYLRLPAFITIILTTIVCIKPAELGRGARPFGAMETEMARYINTCLFVHLCGVWQFELVNYAQNSTEQNSTASKDKDPEKGSSPGLEKWELGARIRQIWPVYLLATVRSQSQMLTLSRLLVIRGRSCLRAVICCVPLNGAPVLVRAKSSVMST